ncbi:hypothetical protein V6N12_018825 [Hibiscus sabdariffa]|uniref:RNase H type-1 domain-containing protein n=1 Tax=Hibiscus sabdariffa TaxID=183260 RepID=A0ABR2AUB8_9ROSI
MRIRWQKPSLGWCKLNTDETVNDVTGAASCRGVVCDDNGVWMIGFSKKIDICLTIKAKLRGLYEGLVTTWSIRIDKLVVESDCMELIKLFNNKHGNCVTNWLSKHALVDDFLCHCLMSPPTDVLFLWEHDGLN